MKQTHKWQFKDKTIKVTSDDSKTLNIEIITKGKIVNDVIEKHHNIDRIVMKSIFKEDLQSKEFENKIEKFLQNIYHE